MNQKNKQIEVFFYKKEKTGEIRFLLLKRTVETGGFWQPMTGGVEKEETLEQAIKREAEEETGVTNILNIINTECNYEFEVNEKNYIEYIYGAEVPIESKIILSDEHTEFKWVDEKGAFELLKWPGNKEGLKRLIKILRKKI